MGPGRWFATVPLRHVPYQEPPTALPSRSTLWQAYRSYAMRMARDPIMFMHAFHTGCTLVHFIVWAAAYK